MEFKDEEEDDIEEDDEEEEASFGESDDNDDEEDEVKCVIRFRDDDDDDDSPSTRLVDISMVVVSLLVFFALVRFSVFGSSVLANLLMYIAFCRQLLSILIDLDQFVFVIFVYRRAYAWLSETNLSRDKRWAEVVSVLAFRRA